MRLGVFEHFFMMSKDSGPLAQTCRCSHTKNLPNIEREARSHITDPKEDAKHGAA